MAEPDLKQSDCPLPLNFPPPRRCWHDLKNSQRFPNYSCHLIPINFNYWGFYIYFSHFQAFKNKIIETYKVQSIIIYQPVWYKKYNLGSLALLTAGGLVHVGVFNYKALQLISNNVAFKVENSNKGWM